MANMYMVSCREFWSATEFSGRTRFVNSTTATGRRSFRRVPGGRGRQAGHGAGSRLQQRAARRARELPHHRPADAAARISGRASSPYDALVGFAWPGGASGVSFPFARGSAPAKPRRACGSCWRSLQGAGVIVDIEHAQPRRARDVRGAAGREPSVVRNAWNFASAVDNESVEKGERYFAAWQTLPEVLRLPLEERSGAARLVPRRRLLRLRHGARLSGPEDPRAIMDASPNVKVINCKDVVASHGGYRRPARYGRSCSAS